MRVLHTIASLRSDTGGPARSVPGLASALSCSGAEVSIWAADIPEDFQAPDGVRLCMQSLDNIITKNATWDIIHDHGLWLPQNHKVATLAERFAVPRIVSPRGMLEPWALNYRKWKKRIAWLLYQGRDLKSAVALHATAESEASQFRKLGLSAPVITQPNGVDLPRVFKRQSAEGSPRTAIFLSRIHPKKGLPLLVEAWAAVKPSGWRMLVVGPDEGSHLEEIRSLVHVAGLEGQWDFHPAMEEEEKWQALVEADLLILPTYSENFGIAVVEALAVGVPVITTTGTPWSELRDHQCGWWVKPESGAIGAALEAATKMNSEQLSAMGRKGLDLVVEKYTWPKIGEDMFGVYTWVLGGGSPPACVRLD